ncbi:MAG: hypothetical protein A2V83_02590 [Nitrospirae bacterium RBG_16_64_22]|nr:MAG: hypothetical protein A2V83_02590 [Nitrospirae bacterium RBG_16_64_22]
MDGLFSIQLKANIGQVADLCQTVIPLGRCRGTGRRDHCIWAIRFGLSPTLLHFYNSFKFNRFFLDIDLGFVILPRQVE